MKKIISNGVALLVTSATIVSLAASSTFNFNKDPNGDGDLDFADNIYITQYLYGHHEPSELTQLDVDDNDVVSTVDAQYVHLYCLGLLNDSLINVENTINRTEITNDYYVYNAQNGTYLRNYSLTVSEDNNSGSKGSNDVNDIKREGGDVICGTRGIVGNEDNRIPDWSNRGVAKIMCGTDESEVGYLGSGFVVGPHTIATAAHVVFKTEINHAYKLSEIFLFDANQTCHSFTPVEYHIPASFANEYFYTALNDYALITVEEDLSNYNSFVLGTVTDTALINELNIKTVGFPTYIYSNIESQTSYTSSLINNGTLHDERLSSGQITNLDNDIIYYDADTSKGNSGGPVYVEESLNNVNYRTIIGINVAQPQGYDFYAQYNKGVRFNAPILKFYKGNNNIYY